MAAIISTAILHASLTIPQSFLLPDFSRQAQWLATPLIMLLSAVKDWFFLFTRAVVARDGISSHRLKRLRHN